MEQTSNADSPDAIIKIAARTSVDCMQLIAEKADEGLRVTPTASSDHFATGNVLNNTKQIAQLLNARLEVHDDYRRLCREPLLARIDYEDEDGQAGELFVAPVGAPAGIGHRVAALNSPAGGIASQRPGSEFPLTIRGKEHEVVIKAVTKLFSQKFTNEWDSVNSQITILDHRPRTIPSLRNYLKSGTIDSEPVSAPINILEKLLAEEEKRSGIIEGLLRPEVDGVGLRQQRIVDEYQNEIFRMPINNRLFLSGPPGTGKTTTLIRRLGQKVDLKEGALTEAELAIISKAGDIAEHPKSWMMFSPTELLKQYVKENFAREGIPASEENIKTWNQYRAEIARDYLGLLNTSKRKGLFNLVEGRPKYLADRCGSSRDSEWYDAYKTYFWLALAEDLVAEAHSLARSQDAAVSEIGKKISEILSAQKRGLDSDIIFALARIRNELVRAISEMQTLFVKISNLMLNTNLSNDSAFLDNFGKADAEIRRSSDGEIDEDDTDAVFDEEDDEQDRGYVSLQSRRAITKRYEKLLRTLGSARANGKKPSAKSDSGKLVAWLGEDRLPNDEQMRQLAHISQSQRRLRKFLRVDRLIMRAIIPKFRAFRAEDAFSGDWYVDHPGSPSEVSWLELDLLILATLQLGAEVTRNLERIADAEPPSTGILAEVKALYRNQILVDEVTDFSLIQVAIMNELANPKIRSFFICGDFNQRLTEWGITSESDLNWINRSFEARSVSISYRQTLKLVELASAVVGLSGSSQSVTVPDYNDIDGVPAVWGANLATTGEKAEWLRERIGEIERYEDKLPSIAVLVNSEDQVEPLATELNRLLGDINYSAEACKDGKTIGSEKTIRVFDIQHIKGLEFQAAFFMDMDDLMRLKPTLYSKYLYVGVTRAATYFGVTFKHEIPKPLTDVNGGVKSGHAAA